MFLALQQETLMLLFRKGPLTEGVFRVPCNSKNLNTLRDQLNSGAEVEMEALPVTLLVGLLKVNNTLFALGPAFACVGLLTTSLVFLRCLLHNK